MKKIDWQVSVTLKNLFLFLWGFKEIKSFFASGCRKLICAVRVLNFLYNILLGGHIILILTTVHPKGRSQGVGPSPRVKSSLPIGWIARVYLWAGFVCPSHDLTHVPPLFPWDPQTSSSSPHHSPLLIVRTHHWMFLRSQSLQQFSWSHLPSLCYHSLPVTDLSIMDRTAALTSSYHDYRKIASVWSAKTFSDIIFNLAQSRTPSSRSAPYP